MKFPGSKLLYSFDLAARTLPLDELLRSCQQVGLTGFAELKTPDGVGMIFYYLGSETNALFREGAQTHHGADALEALRRKVTGGEGAFAVYELPLDMAHVLRGITNRRRMPDTLSSRADLLTLLEKMELVEHTGTLEIQTRAGAGMLLLVRGRLSNVYWETPGGLTFEKGEARQKLEEALPQSGGAPVFQSDFSQVVWKGRHEVEASVRRDMEPARAGIGAQVAAEENATRNEVLEQLQAQVPALMQAFVFDLMTGSPLARRGRGTDALRVGLLAEKVPPLTMYLKDLVAAAQGDDEVELVELSTGKLAILIALVPEAQEAIAILADRSQPTALIESALTRAARAYAARLHPARGVAAAS